MVPESLLGGGSFRCDPLNVEVVLLEHRGQDGSNRAVADDPLVADLGRCLLERGLVELEVVLPVRPERGRVGLIVARTAVELVYLPGPVRVAVGALCAVHGRERGLGAVGASTAGGCHS